MFITRKKLIILLSFVLFLLFNSCATTNQYKTNRQKQGLMLQNNTEMKINKKYHSKHNKKTKRKSARQSNRRR